MSDTNKAERGMRRLTCRLFVAFLTFIIGVSAAALWLYHRTPLDVSRMGQGQWSANLPSEQEKANPQANVEWIYIETPLDLRENYFATATIIALSADGRWLQTYVLGERENGKLKLSLRYGHHDLIVTGSWKQNKDGDIAITVENCRCSIESEPLDGGHEAEYPFTTRWTLSGGVFGQKRSILRTSHAKLRLLQRDKLAADNVNGSLNDFLRAVGNEKLSRRCLKEDLSLVIK